MVPRWRQKALGVDLPIGWVNSKGGSIFSLDFFDSMSQERVVATGSGSPVAYGIFESEYREGATATESYPVAAKAIIAAMRRNVFTGDYFDIAVMNRAGFREISEQEKGKLLAQFTIKA
jgi:proteasome beta subunit